jgi:hypothetical protein
MAWLIETFCGLFSIFYILVVMGVEEVTFGEHIYRIFGGFFPLSLNMRP